MSKIRWQDSCIDNVIATRKQQTFDSLRAIADKAHQLESRGLISNVYAEVRERATNQGVQFSTTQLHNAIEESNREYHALNIVRAELRAMVEEEEESAHIETARERYTREGIEEYVKRIKAGE